MEIKSVLENLIEKTKKIREEARREAEEIKEEKEKS